MDSPPPRHPSSEPNRRAAGGLADALAGAPNRDTGGMKQGLRRLVAGYSSDSALDRTPRRRQSEPYRELRDPATEPLIGTDNEPDFDSDREGPRGAPGGHGDLGYELEAPQALLDYHDPYRSPLEDPVLIQPRKSRWNKKVTRKRGAARPPATVRKGRLAAYCISSELSTEKLQAFFLSKRKERAGIYASAPPGGDLTFPVKRDGRHRVEEELVGPPWAWKNYMGVLHYFLDDGKMEQLDVRHCFFFPYGCAVFWGCTKEEEEAFLRLASDYAIEPVSAEEREESYDDFLFLYGEANRIFNYEITLTTNDPEEKLALSFSLAQSAKLFVFEDRVDATISSSKSIPVELASQGRITLSRKEISRLTGKVFLERNEVNLHSDVLDTPEWFWEKDLHEPLYKRFCLYLDIPNRIEILNKRLDILRELLDVLNTQLENSHSTKLEWIVIWLIVVEVVLQVLQMLFDIFGFSLASEL